MKIHIFLRCSKAEKEQIWKKLHKASTTQKWIYEKLKFKEFYDPKSKVYKKLYDMIFKLWAETYEDEIQLNQQKIQKKKNMNSYVPELPEMVHI